MTSFFRFLLISLAFILGTTSAGNAASFDCSKATTETEIAICNDPQLSKLDEIVSELYKLKASINLTENELSYRTNEPKFPRFFKEDTRNNQIAWINNERSECYANSKCLLLAYNQRITHFFNLDAPQREKSWKILDKLDLVNAKYSTIIWTFDSNPGSEQNLEVDFTPIFYLVTVHDNKTDKLIDYNSGLIEIKHSARRIDEIELSSTSEKQITISMSTFMSSGGWGSSTNQLSFNIVQNKVVLSHYKYFEFERNIHFFRTKKLISITEN